MVATLSSFSSTILVSLYLMKTLNCSFLSIKPVPRSMPLDKLLESLSLSALQVSSTPLQNTNFSSETRTPSRPWPQAKLTKRIC